jgi:hypothetical protein
MKSSLVKSFGDQSVDDPEIRHAEPFAETGDARAIRADSIVDQRAALTLEIEQKDRQMQSDQNHQDRFDRAGY